MSSRTPLKDRARGRWKEILPQVIGIDVRVLDNKHHGCPLCGGKDRWRFDDKDGRGTSICGQCGGRDGIGLVMAAKDWDFQTAAIEIEKVIGTEPAADRYVENVQSDDAQKYLEARRHWGAGRRIVAGDPVDLYLRARIGDYPAPMSLRTIPATAFGGQVMPAMVSAYVDAHGELAGIQRTFLTDDGRKVPGLEADRWNTGKLPDGGAVRLARFDPVSRVLGIAEGVETALSASAMFTIPVWAALNANRLQVWQPPEGVDEIVVFGDADPNYAGQAAAFVLANRLEIQRRCKVQVMLPDHLGVDWNDVLNDRRRAA